MVAGEWSLMQRCRLVWPAGLSWGLRESDGREFKLQIELKSM
jgi:hypothetical protein